MIVVGVLGLALFFVMGALRFKFQDSLDGAFATFMSLMGLAIAVVVTIALLGGVS